VHLPHRCARSRPYGSGLRRPQVVLEDSSQAFRALDSARTPLLDPLASGPLVRALGMVVNDKPGDGPAERTFPEEDHPSQAL